MFIVSMKANKRKVLFAIFIIVIIFASIYVLFNGNTANQVNEHRVASHIVENNEQRINYLKSFGWNVSNEPVEIIDVAIPEEFNDVYTVYNKIQKEQGFNLEKYKGKKVKRYTYEVKNYPNESQYIRANMLVYNNQIIAGDICSIKIDGFMHGFALPKKTN